MTAAAVEQFSANGAEQKPSLPGLAGTPLRLEAASLALAEPSPRNR
ncbi:hypothetical protein ABT173_16990 [Streptomyces sp. NPDC001795]